MSKLLIQNMRKIVCFTFCHTTRKFSYGVTNPSPVVAVVAYGDETYVPFQSWNVGNCTVGAGVSYLIYIDRLTVHPY
jgi:hypothetical protein